METNIPLTVDQKYFLSSRQRNLILKQNQIMVLQQELPKLAKELHDGIQQVAKACNVQPGFDFDDDLNIVAIPRSS
jgi:signal transduction histidine kinase